METSKNFEVFFRKRPSMVLVTLRSTKRRYGSSLVREIGCNYSHLFKILKTLERLGLIKKGKKDGRISYLELTEKGNEMSMHIDSIRRLLMDDEKT